MDLGLQCEPIMKEIKEALQNNDKALAVAKIQEHLDKQNNAPLNIAITGEFGSGKSTFINAFRGINERDERAAPTGCVETTTEVKPYPHPDYPNVTLWDLPGIGTTKFPADKYLKHVGFERFDFFIIVSDTRFRENDVKLAQVIQRMGKRFYFVRSKIDNDLRAEKKSKRDRTEDRTLTQIRKYCIQGLKTLGIKAPQVFLVSSFQPRLYDFPLLHETLERELPEHKRNALLLAFPNMNLEIIKKKKEAFQSQIKFISTVSAAVAAVPLPGLSIGVDIVLLVGAVTNFVVGFGLDISSLWRLAKSTGVKFKYLVDFIKSPLTAKKITPDLILEVLTSFSTTVVLMAVEEVSRLIPVLGIPVSMSISFVTTYKILNKILDMLAEDAQKVFKKALGLNISV